MFRRQLRRNGNADTAAGQPDGDTGTYGRGSDTGTDAVVVKWGRNTGLALQDRPV
jgi:hypothetical protein